MFPYRNFIKSPFFIEMVARRFLSSRRCQKSNGPIIGIDLGTTNTRVSVMDGKMPKIIKNYNESQSLPSIVSFTKTNEPVLGVTAKKLSITNASNTFVATRRLVGYKFDDSEAQKIQKVAPYTMVPGPNGEVMLSSHGMNYSPSEISALILGKIKKTAENYLGQSVENAVITVPTYFNHAQRQAMREAAGLAGLNVVRLANESTAAALAYGMDKSDSLFVVYDIGGFTFDLSLIEVNKGRFQVKSTSANSFLGGEDFTGILSDYLAKEFRREHGLLVPMQNLRQTMKRAESDLLSILKIFDEDVEYILKLGSIPKEGTYHNKKVMLLSRDIARIISSEVSSLLQAAEVKVDKTITELLSLLQQDHDLSRDAPAFRHLRQVTGNACKELFYLLQRFRDATDMSLPPLPRRKRVRDATEKSLPLPPRRELYFECLVENTLEKITSIFETFQRTVENETEPSILLQQGLTINSDPVAYYKLWQAAEKAKVHLSTELQIDVNVPCLMADANRTMNLNVNLTRGEYESLVNDLIQQTIYMCKEMLPEIKQTKSNVDSVILSGGLTHMPKIQSTVKELFGNCTKISDEPDEAVAAGAAIIGGIASGHVHNVSLTDIVPLSLGMETHGGIFTKFIQRNSPCPTVKSKVLSTALNNLNKLEIKIFQGERGLTEHNKMIGLVELAGLSPQPRGIPQIDITFDIDANGVLQVSVRDQDSGSEQELIIQNSYDWNQEEIDSFVSSAEKHEEEDKLRIEEIQFMNTIERVIHDVETKMAELDDHPSLNDVREKIAKVQNMMKDKDSNSRDDITAAADELNQSSAPIFDQVVQEMVSARESHKDQQAEGLKDEQEDKTKKT